MSTRTFKPITNIVFGGGVGFKLKVLVPIDAYI